MEHFGTLLKTRREERGLSLAELSRATKIKESLLELVEAADLERLPATVFVRGFVLAYARAVGADELEVMRRFKYYMSDRAEPTVPTAPPIDPSEGSGEPERKRFGVVMVVLLILVVATLTLSLLLRHGRGASEGLSQISSVDVSA